jgi:hypothetical protein
VEIIRRCKIVIRPPNTNIKGKIIMRKPRGMKDRNICIIKDKTHKDKGHKPVKGNGVDV